MEAVATGLLCYLSGLIGRTIIRFYTDQGAAYVAVANIFLLTLFIMAAGPGSGGHVHSPTAVDTAGTPANQEPGQSDDYLRNNVDWFDWLLTR